MSDHLLECPSSNTCECNMGPVHKDSCPQRKKCICTELRACEQRVAAETISRLDRWQQHSPLGRKTYDDGLSAARDAVAGLPMPQEVPIIHSDNGQQVYVRMRAALAAIDALRSHHDT